VEIVAHDDELHVKALPEGVEKAWSRETPNVGAEIQENDIVDSEVPEELQALLQAHDVPGIVFATEIPGWISSKGDYYGEPPGLDTDASNQLLMTPMETVKVANRHRRRYIPTVYGKPFPGYYRHGRTRIY
jgi:hypothetical protein